MKRLLFLCPLLIAAAASADTLANVKSAVNRLSPKQAVRATYSVEHVVHANGKYTNQDVVHKASTEVAHDAAGVSILVPQQLIDQRADDAIGTIQTTTVVDAIDFRARLLSMLDHASVTEEKRVAYRGRPARLLTLRLTMPRRDDTVSVGSVEKKDVLNLWVGDDNLPIAGERVEDTTAGFLFLKGTFSAHTSYTFAHTADRLMLVRMESADGGSGMGQNVHRTSVQTLTVH